MCGLCGSFTAAGVQLNKSRRLQRARALEGLLIANQVRGTDSTGLAAIDFNGNVEVFKRAVEPWDFVKDDRAHKTVRLDAPIMIGHTRMSSMPGDDVTDANAHPFVEGNVVGAHNGVINNYMQLDKTVSVDSQAVFRLLNNELGSFDDVFQQVSGSCTLTWWDARDPNGMYIVAHYNPLSVAIVPSISTVFWSSQSEHLEPVMRAVYGRDVAFMDVKSDTVYRLDSNDVYAWQEEKVTFRGYETNYRYPAHWGGDEDTYDVFGVSRKDIYGSGSSVAGTASSGKAQGQEQESLNLPVATITPQEDEQRYEDYWNRLMGDDSQSESDDEQSESAGGNASRLHALTDNQYHSLEAGEGQFIIDDDSGEMECGYCDRPLNGSGIYDSGLDMILCKPCQNWWDNYGQDYKSNYPTPQA